MEGDEEKEKEKEEEEEKEKEVEKEGEEEKEKEVEKEEKRKTISLKFPKEGENTAHGKVEEGDTTDSDSDDEKRPYPEDPGEDCDGPTHVTCGCLKFDHLPNSYEEEEKEKEKEEARKKQPDLRRYALMRTLWFPQMFSHGFVQQEQEQRGGEEGGEGGGGGGGEGRGRASSHGN